MKPEREHYVGAAGSAEWCPMPEPSGDPDDWKLEATIGVWLFDCPGQSPAWRQYLMSAINLRDIEGQDKPATKRTPECTHEFILSALDAEQPIGRTWMVDEDGGRPRFLQPFNVLYQVESLTDEQAAKLLELCTRAVCDGMLPAEPMFGSNPVVWIRSLEMTAEHLRLGGHPAAEA